MAIATITMPRRLSVREELGSAAKRKKKPQAR
jgi:hypothetical protein